MLVRVNRASYVTESFSLKWSSNLHKHLDSDMCGATCLAPLATVRKGGIT